MNTKSLANVDETEAVEGFEQTFSFKIGEEGYTYESCLERDNEGNITNAEEGEALNDPKIDSETWVAHYFNTDPYAWADLDQRMWDADEGEEFLYYWNAQSVCGNPYEFSDEDMEFIEKHMDKEGYVKVYITILENTIIKEE